MFSRDDARPSQLDPLRRAPRRLRGFAALASTAALALASCIVVDDHHDHPPEEPRPEDPIIESVSIDEGAEIAAEPGVGVGIFVEHLGTGRWHVWTTCDTELTDASCDFDLFLEGAGLEVAASDDLEGADELEQRGDLLRASFITAFDTDGVTIDLEEGSALRLEVWLDGALDAQFVSWVSGGVVQTYPPSNPVDFVP